MGSHTCGSLGSVRFAVGTAAGRAAPHRCTHDTHLQRSRWRPPGRRASAAGAAAGCRDNSSWVWLINSHLPQHAILVHDPEGGPSEGRSRDWSRVLQIVCMLLGAGRQTQHPMAVCMKLRQGLARCQLQAVDPCWRPEGPANSHVEVELGHLLVVRDLDLHSCFWAHLQQRLPG